DLVPASVQQWQYLLPVEVGPTLVERYVGGDLDLYLQCRLEDVSGGQAKPCWEAIWEAESRLVKPAQDFAKRHVRKNRVEFPVCVTVSDLVEEPKRLRTSKLVSSVRLHAGNRFSVGRTELVELGLERLPITRFL